MNILPSYFGDLNEDVSKIIIKSIYSDEIKNHENDKQNKTSKVYLSSKYPLSQIWIQHSLELLPHAFSLGLLSKTSRSFRALCAVELNAIKEQIENNFKKIPTSGSESCFYEKCIKMSVYFPALRIYYTLAPEALKNIPRDGSHRNIVHDLIVSKMIFAAPPQSFISFVLEKSEKFASKSINGRCMDFLAEKDVNGHLPIHTLCVYNNINNVEEFCKTLEELFKSPTAVLYVNALAPRSGDSIENVPPLYFLKHSVCAELLLDKGANVNEQSDLGNTVLHLWTRELKYELILTILKRGADLTIQNHCGETALDFFLTTIFDWRTDINLGERAISEQELKIIKCLLDNGASIKNLLIKLHAVQFEGSTGKSFVPRSPERAILDLLKKEYTEIFTSTINKIYKATQKRGASDVKIRAEAQLEAKPEAKTETAKSQSGFFNYLFKMMLKPFRFIFEKAMSLFSFARSNRG